MEQLDKLQQDWAIINASRELLSIVKRNPYITYKNAIRFAKEIDPLLLDTKVGSHRKNRLEKLFEKYAQEAFALSREQDRSVSPETLIENRVLEIEKALKYYTKEDEDPEDLKKEVADLKGLLKKTSSDFLDLVRITENQAIAYDAFGKRPDKIWIRNDFGKFNTYIDRQNRNIFRVAVLHPNQAEIITGADLIYEQYDESKDKVRIVAMQYKVWENYTLYFSQAGNLNDQLRKMANCFCGDQFCTDHTGNNVSSVEYRMPYCCAFLKPTDKLQNPTKLTTSGFHLPICKVDSVKKEGRRDFIITLDDMLGTAIKSQTFEELFNANILGSRWLHKLELEQLYRKTKILEATEKIVLYAQNVVFDI